MFRPGQKVVCVQPPLYGPFKDFPKRHDICTVIDEKTSWDGTSISLEGYSGRYSNNDLRPLEQFPDTAEFQVVEEKIEILTPQTV